jgi:hypothetical protein
MWHFDGCYATIVTAPMRVRSLPANTCFVIPSEAGTHRQSLVRVGFFPNPGVLAVMYLGIRNQIAAEGSGDDTETKRNTVSEKVEFGCDQTRGDPDP